MIKDVLNKPPEERHSDDLNRVVGLLKEIKFFKDRDIQEADLP